MIAHELNRSRHIQLPLLDARVFNRKELRQLSVGRRVVRWSKLKDDVEKQVQDSLAVLEDAYVNVMTPNRFRPPIACHVPIRAVVIAPPKASADVLEWARHYSLKVVRASNDNELVASSRACFAIEQDDGTVEHWICPMKFKYTGMLLRARLVVIDGVERVRVDELELANDLGSTSTFDVFGFLQKFFVKTVARPKNIRN